MLWFVVQEGFDTALKDYETIFGLLCTSETGDYLIKNGSKTTEKKRKITFKRTLTRTGYYSNLKRAINF